MKNLIAIMIAFAFAAFLNLNAENINATYWCAWGNNTSYNVSGKQIPSNPIDMNKINSCYNVIITAFIVTDNKGDFELSLKDPGSQGDYYYSVDQMKQMINDAKSQGKKVLVSVGGEYFSYNMQTEEQKSNFVTQIEEIINEYGFEGLDLDLESGATVSDPQLMAEAVMQVVKNYRDQGKDFWLTAAPEWCYIVPFMYGTGQWASHSLAGTFYVNLINDIGVNNFTYIWPQTYNQGPANGVSGPENDATGYPAKVTTQDGMDNFLSALAWAASTDAGYKANGSIGVIIPPDKLALGIPATEGAAGGEMTYIATPELIQSAWSKILSNNDRIAGFMNWSVDWDALNITDGMLTPGYTHTEWATGIAVQNALENKTSVLEI